MIVCPICGAGNKDTASHCRGCGTHMINPHSRSKYRVLAGFFSQVGKARNIGYLETHGGTGKIVDKKYAAVIDGSVRTVAKTCPNMPSIALELHPKRAKLLKQNTLDLGNVDVIEGNCNDLVDQALLKLSGYVLFCFCDPHGLVYRRGKHSCPELEWTTIESIAHRGNTDLLLTYPILALFRNAAQIIKRPADPRSPIKAQRVTALIGDSRWTKVGIGDYRSWLRLLLDTKLKIYYQFMGAFLLRNSTNAPVLYLVYGTNDVSRAEVMRKVMFTEYNRRCVEKGKFPFTTEDSVDRFIYDF